MKSAIQTNKLTRKFDQLIAVNHLSFQVQSGEIFGLVGPDGAGKTTTIRMLAGILEPTSGDAWVNGFHTIKQSDQVQESIAYMSQQFGLYQDLTVEENIDFYADLYGVSTKNRAAKIEELLRFSNMQPFKKRLAAHLSGGMKQKLQLMCALIHKPTVLLLDEPTNGVDPVSRRDFWSILYQLLREGVTILISTAYLDEAERCHRVGLMHQGQMIACGSPAEVKRLMSDYIVEIQSINARAILQLLRTHQSFSNVGLIGDKVHIVTSNPDDTIQQLKPLLAAHNLAYETIAQVPASLEDVFISVIAQMPNE